MRPPATPMPTLSAFCRPIVLTLLGTSLLAQGTGPVPSVRAVPAKSVTLVRGTAVSLELPQEPAPGVGKVEAVHAPTTTLTPEQTLAAKGRFERFKALPWDRRPSTVLKAWVAPELKPYDPAEEAAKAKPVEVAPMTAEEIEAELTRQFGQQPPAGAAAVAVDPAAAAAQEERELAEKRLAREFEMLQRDVTLGRWARLGEFFGSLVEADRKPAYEHFLRMVLMHPQRPEDQRVPPNLQEKNRFGFEDAIAIAGIAPGGFDKKQAPLLAPIVTRAMEAGSVLEELLRQLVVETTRPPAEQRLDRREAALLLIALGHDVEIGPLLPTAADAEKDNDREGLNLIARHALAMYAKEKRTTHLETAWRVTQAALAKGEIGDDEKAEALRRAVELAPKVHADLGPAWLAESFAQRPERGMEIIATIGTLVARGFQENAQDADFRGVGLTLQKTAVEALLQTAPELAGQWRPTLALLAAGWINEAAYSYTNSQSDSLGPMLQRDEYGNFFYGSMRRGGGGQVAAIEPDDVLKAQPGPQWATLLDESLAPHFLTISAQLCLKVNEPARAFPFIEQLAGINPRKAKELAGEFLRVWTRNHNPNPNRTNRYMFMYGFDQRADGIPLTRSKQERNLAELATWVERLRRLPIEGGVDQKLLTEAFQSAHSAAEVYQLDAIQKVFGDIGALDPQLLAELLGKMRTNLATVWRVPAVQEHEKTKRSQRETMLEVANGYETALTIAQDGLASHGRHWALLAVVASILHDQNNFAQEQANDSGFADRRKAAFALFQEAAKAYAAGAGDLRLDEETIAPFDTWFYAALGAADLGAVDEDKVVAKNQIPLIRAAIDALPKGSDERHLSMFANALFTRMSAVKPQIKYRYLEAGFGLVGDHPQAYEAKKVWDYYQDLLHELRLEAVVDGSTQVGTAPFGVRIDIVHTRAIERESGGFQKYATNQNTGAGFYYNYGRPLENYRDRFQEAVTAALQEHFEVLSVTFNSEVMASKPADEPGWRMTPYAWLLLKARGPQVDRLPVLQIDFDFNDTSGYMVLPVGTAPVVIDASHQPEPRPFAGVEIAQILDERRTDEGKVTLEIKAKAKGLVPDLETLLTLTTPGFTVKKRDDQGAAVVKFSEDQQTIESERVWLLSLEPSGTSRPGSFRFGEPRDEAFVASYQRYADADLETVSPLVALQARLRVENPWWAWLLLGLALVAYCIWFFSKPAAGRGPAASAELTLPRHVTAFSVLGLLREIAARGRFPVADRELLAADIRRIERRHFERGDDEAIDLTAVATRWLSRLG